MPRKIEELTMKRPLILLTSLLLGILDVTLSHTLSIVPNQVTLEPRETVAFKAIAFNDRYQPQKIDNIEWELIPEDLGRISEDGFFIAGQNPAKGRVIAKGRIAGESVRAAAPVIIRPSENPVKVSIQPEKAFIHPGEQQQFNLIAKSKEGILLQTERVKWFVDPPALGSMDEAGLFTAGERHGHGKVIALSTIKGVAHRTTAPVFVGDKPSAWISGSVTNESGEPITDVRLEATKLTPPLFSKRARTDAEGKYTLGRLLPGQYVVKAFAKEYVPEFYQNAYSNDEATIITIAEDDSLTGFDFQLETGAQISGTVKDDSGQPLENALVTFYSPLEPRYRAHAISDENGNYSLNGLRPGDYIAFANKQGFLRQYFDQQNTPDAAQLIAVDLDGDLQGIDFNLSMTHALTGRIVSSPDDSPLQGAIIMVAKEVQKPLPGKRDKWLRKTRSDKDGKFAIQLNPGRYCIMAAADSFQAEFYDNALSVDEATLVEITEDQHTEIHMALDPLGSLTGTITDSETGEPIKGATIRIFSENRNAAHKPVYHGKSDDQGIYTLSAIQSGSYKLVVQAAGYIKEFYENAQFIHEATPVKITAAQTKTIDVDLGKGSSLAGVITDNETEIPLAGATITLLSTSDRRIQHKAKTNKDGEYTVQGITAGNYLLKVRHPHYFSKWYEDAESRDEAKEIEINAQTELQGIDLKLERRPRFSGSITGTVIDSTSGLPVEGAKIVAMPRSFARPVRAISDAEGNYELTGLEAGVYSVACHAEGFLVSFYENSSNWKHAEKIRIPKDGQITGIDFRLGIQDEGGYAIQGEIVNETGLALEGTLVMALDDDHMIASTLTDEKGSYSLQNLPIGSFKITAQTPQEVNSQLLNPVDVSAAAETIAANMVIATSTEVNSNQSLPDQFSLEQNYPNPFNPTTEITFALPEQAEVTLSIFNILGQPVKILYYGVKQAGTHSVTWDGRNERGALMASGTYFYRMTVITNGQTITQNRRMMLLK
jgi:protocatechuate 3,4-dioxygenase beta subunit